MAEEKKKKQYSEMMERYLEKKRQYPDTFLFYRLGDFYEMFFDDALKASNILGITLTARDCGNGQKAPMCGVPYHAADIYISRLTSAGYKVAICEQVGPIVPNKIVEREVVRIVTPGTMMDDNQLIQRKNNYIACVSAEKESVVGLSWIDLMTGEFYLQQFTGDDAFSNLSDTLVSIAPSEIISDEFSFNESSKLTCERMGVVPCFYQHKSFAFEYDNARKTILRQLNASSLKDINCDNILQAVCAGGGLLDYLTETQMRDLTHINKVKIINDNHFMHLDINARLNLEICETLFDRKKKGSLLWVIDKTRSTMGARQLRNWLEQPLQDDVEINDRLDAVEELTNNTIARTELAELLRSLQDIERLCGRVSYGNLNPKNCFELGSSLSKLPQIKKIISRFNSKLLKKCANNIAELGNLADELLLAFDEKAPTTIKDGGFIKEGYNAELDVCIEANTKGREWANELEQKERELTGEPRLKINYNKIVGYCFEIPKSGAENLPFRFQKIQTLTNSVRFMTNDLRKIIETINTAEERKVTLELQLFNEIRQHILDKIKPIQNSARQIAIIDCLLSLADVAVENDYTKPIINKDVKDIEILQSRHPVVEKLMTNERFVPNDVVFNDNQRTIIITGPNMAGKSTYMRQIALIVLLAHIGSFVPAKSAKIAITDRIFTRIGASDNLGMGQSTFMVEMNEVANIIKNATSNSLLILDEIGRGTSTQDGLSIAWAVLEYIATTIKARTLFSTHYHKLTELQGKLPGVINMRVTVSEFDNQMSFLRKVEYGSTNQSFGVEVAKLAGIPQTIINRAKEVMKDEEIVQDQAFDKAIDQYKNEDLGIKTKYEIIADILNKTDINNLTPLEALSKIAELKKKVQ